MIGILYFLAFQILGLLTVFSVLKNEKFGFSILIGSVLGSFSLQWFPIIFSFPFDFTVTSHVVGLFVATAIALVIAFKCKSTLKENLKHVPDNPVQVCKEHPVVFLILPLYLYCMYVLSTHTLHEVNGSLHAGQCTFGDMNMHLGFITSIAKQHSFPPDYSILPGTKLSYPFLSDSISSSLYLLGSDIRTAYLFPMLFAFLQVFFGAYSLITYILKTKGKAFLAFCLFFLNGGFGIYYFINEGLFKNGDWNENFTRIFTAFYETPTNYVVKNVRFTNIIVDMLIPQRATLFGYAILFPIMCLIWKAVHKEGCKRYFILAGVLAGGLPMIHTHSFMALGLVCFTWLMCDLVKQSENTKTNYILRAVLLILPLLALNYLSGLKQNPAEMPLDNTLLGIGIAFVAVWVVVLGVLLIKNWDKRLIFTWGIFLVIVLFLAVPQLFYWTFRQASNEGFLRGHFNWANEPYNDNQTIDSFTWFYFKNLGITFVLLIIGILYAKREKLRIILPTFLIFCLAEFVVFQPNIYDNNKLLLVAFFFICVFSADVTVDLLSKLKNKYIVLAGSFIVLFAGSISGILTMGREAVSDYELYSADYVEIAEYINDNIKTPTTFLTDNNHNNAIASLTGNNIVCGTGSFLYYHGLDYRQNEQDLQIMFSDPSQRDALLQQYSVDYIVVGPYEMAKNIPDLDQFETKYELEYETETVKLFRVPNNR